MARHDEAAKLLKSGNPPREIAKQWGIPCSSVAQVLYTAVGRGLITRSDILLAIGDNAVDLVNAIVNHNGIRNRWDLQRFLRERVRVQAKQDDIKEDDIDEVLLCFDLRTAPLADMYEMLCQLERYLHELIRLALVQEFDKNWWDELPATIRKQCRNKQEDDPERNDDPYCYTTFIDLHDICKEQWAHLSKKLPGRVRANKKLFLSRLQTLNGIRNRVMHPVRDYRPTRADFDFIRTFVDSIFVDADEGVEAE